MVDIAPNLEIIEEIGSFEGAGEVLAAGKRACAGNDRITDWIHSGKIRYSCEDDRFVNGVETTW